MRVCFCVSVCVCMSVCVHACMRACMRACVRVCVYDNKICCVNYSLRIKRFTEYENKEIFAKITMASSVMLLLRMWIVETVSCRPMGRCTYIKAVLGH